MTDSTESASPPDVVRIKAVTAEALSLQEAEDREFFDEMSATGAAKSADSAGKWQAGILAITAFVTGGVFLKGPEAANDLHGCWRTLFVACVAMALVLATVGLLAFISISSGLVISTSRDKILKKHGSVAAYVRSREERASILTVLGVWFALGAVVLLVIATLTWLIVPKEESPDRISVTTHTGEKLCGKLLSSIDDKLLISDDSTKTTTYTLLPVDSVKQIDTVDGC